MFDTPGVVSPVDRDGAAVVAVGDDVAGGAVVGTAVGVRVGTAVGVRVGTAVGVAVGADEKQKENAP